MKPLENKSNISRACTSNAVKMVPRQKREQNTGTSAKKEIKEIPELQGGDLDLSGLPKRKKGLRQCHESLWKFVARHESCQNQL